MSSQALGNRWHGLSGEKVRSSDARVSHCVVNTLYFKLMLSFLVISIASHCSGRTRRGAAQFFSALFAAQPPLRHSGEDICAITAGRYALHVDGEAILFG